MLATDQYSNPNTCNTVKLPDHACLMAGLKHWHSVQDAALRGCSPQTRVDICGQINSSRACCGVDCVALVNSKTLQHLLRNKRPSGKG